jgi:hypothetical protein
MSRFAPDDPENPIYTIYLWQEFPDEAEEEEEETPEWDDEGELLDEDGEDLDGFEIY